MTSAPPLCLLLTLDSALPHRLAMTFNGIATVCAADSRLNWSGGQHDAAIRLVDLRHPDGEMALTELSPQARSETVAYGVPESEPFRDCLQAGVFACQALDSPAETLRQTLRQAIVLHGAHEELNLFREQALLLQSGSAVPHVESPEREAAPLDEVWRASRHVHDIRKLMEQVVEGVAAAGRITRVGTFARLQGESGYRLWAGVRCLDAASMLIYAPQDLFVRWLERHAYLVCRAHLGHVSDLRERRMLQSVLDAAGAEIIIPLLGKHGLLGWIVVGHRATGIPFTSRDLTDFSVMGEQVATLLENALLLEELAVQKTLAENLLEALPVGILAVSEEGTVRWFNRAAEQILGVTAEQTVGRPVEKAGSRLADVVLRTIRSRAVPEPTVWTDPGTRRAIRVDGHLIGGRDACMGAMLLLSDVSHERLLREKQEELDRHAFWSDLAAAMSHEVRNPLVAISTFAQLLPERYADEEFRQSFYGVVKGEVGRLNAIITQINAFAHPQKLAPRENALPDLIRQACARAAEVCPKQSAIVAFELAEGLPVFSSDAPSLVDGLAHVIINACEAVAAVEGPCVRVRVSCSGTGDDRSFVVTVSDNGPGIAPEVQAKLFSPFSTTKSGGLGLGLPLARRAVVDHGGRIDVDSSPKGTTVAITLPLMRKD